jgi:hypothetical protein
MERMLAQTRPLIDRPLAPKITPSPAGSDDSTATRLRDDLGPRHPTHPRGA